MRKYLTPFLFFLLSGLAFSNLQAQDCECTNCPVPIFDNGIFTGLLEVTVDGPNDLAQCPLEEVCFQITHTWVGDLAVTLTAPDGTNYLVMADEDNGFGGCGTSDNNINVCIQVGTGNPLTNNTNYACNGGNPCLQGNWTMPCGGVTDPITGALQAPNCDLDDFNQPGAPANGVWTLTVNDICSLDVGFLETWSLKFACGIDTCFTACEANGGFLDQPAITACFGDNILSDLNIQPTFPGITPNPNFYDYAFILTQNGIILDILPDTDLTGLGTGTYEICGISFEDGEAGSLLPYIGSPLSELQDDLSGPSPVFCADLSSDCFSLTVQVAIPFTFADTLICVGDCFVAPDGMICCSPGDCEFNLTAANGCDSTIIMNLQFGPPDMVAQEFTLCQDDCLTIDGVDYCPPGVFSIVFTNQFGCDSTLTLTLNEIQVEAVVAPADTVTCVNPVVTLDASNSTADAFTWFNPDGSFLGSGPTQDVDAGGCYTVEVFNTVAGTTCSDLLQICVEEQTALPVEAVISGLPLVCDGDELAYTIPEDPEAVNYNWSIPEGAAIIDGGQDSTYALIDWSGAMSGQICVTATNFCGDGPEHCFDVVVEHVPDRPEFLVPESVCPDELFFVQAVFDSTALSYDWTVPTDAMIVNAQDSTVIEVQWGEADSGEICLTTSNDCGDSETTCITLIKECNQREIPNIFTPNGDDVNDYFKVLKGSGVTVIGFQVYSRWGQLVYDHQNGDAGWDGRFNGELMPTDVYAYIITMTLSDGEVVVEKGEVSLVR